MLWDLVHAAPPDRALPDGDTFEVGGVFTGDTLFQGGPGATIINSIRS